jgi:putative transferase (TIGR04331 family)
MIKKKVLIVTALSKSEKSDEDRVLLGDWCLSYSAGIRTKPKKYHWDNLQKKNKDFIYLNRIYGIYLKKISLTLNTIHNKQYSQEQWRIIIGPWLYKFISIIFERRESIKNIKNIDYIYIAQYKKEDLVPNDFNQAIALGKTDKANNNIYGELVDNFLNYKIKYFDANQKYSENKIFSFTHLKTRILNSIYYIINLLNFKKKHKKFFFIDSCLNFFTLFNIQFKLNEFPFFPKTKIILDVKTKWNMRDWTKYGWKFKEKNISFLNILNFFIPLCLPKSYLENYKYFLHESKRLGWPEKPDFIFTSEVAYDGNDLFKIWLAEKRSNYDFKLITFQHGGSIFQLKNLMPEDHQKKISDQLLTWGYGEKKKNSIIPFFRPYKLKHTLPKKKGGLLFANYTFNRYAYMCNSGFNGHPQNSYLEDKYLFFKNLPMRIISNTYVKQMPTIEDKFRIEDKFFADIFPEISVENGGKKILVDRLTRSRLCVSPANQTVYLDTLSINFPTVVYFNFKYEQVRPSAIPYLNKLKDAGILFDNPIDAAKKINDVWDDIDLWWNQKKTQLAIKTFCNRYSRTSNNLSNEIFNFIKKN